jgi:DNA-binding NarL/FixJ family response regulator
MERQDTRSITVYCVEEIEIYREIYRNIFPGGGSIEIIGMGDNHDITQLTTSLRAGRPDVLLLGMKRLDNAMIVEMERIREEFPAMGIVLLLTVYDLESLKMLRQQMSYNMAGMAVFLKQSLEKVYQLSGVIESVSERHVILDPALTNLLLADKQGKKLLNKFTQRETELLSLIARGYTNSAIAEVLCIDMRTVQRHINNMYSKLRSDIDSDNMNLRVSAARLYLETTGELVSGGVA